MTHERSKEYNRRKEVCLFDRWKQRKISIIFRLDVALSNCVGEYIVQPQWFVFVEIDRAAEPRKPRKSEVPLTVLTLDLTLAD